MKTWLLKLIKHKILVTPVAIRNEKGDVIKFMWLAKQRYTNLERQGDDPTSAVNALVQDIEKNTAAIA